MLRKWIARIMNLLFKKNSEPVNNRNCKQGAKDSNVIFVTHAIPKKTVKMHGSYIAVSSGKNHAVVHMPVIDKEVKASCTAPGLTEGVHCTVCGKVLRQQEEIPPLGHSVVVDNSVPATDMNTGLTEGSHCGVCGKVLVPQKELPMLRERLATENAVNDTEAFLQPTTGHIKMKEVVLTQGPSNATAKHIPAHAYQGRTDICAIDLPDEVTHIDEEAFAGCTALKSLVIPETVRRIGQKAFMDCTALEKVILPSTLKEIPKSCFENCSSLHTVVTGTELHSVRLHP